MGRSVKCRDRVFLLLLCLNVLCGFSWNKADPLQELQALNVEISYYDISGSTLEELRAGIRESGPVDETGTIRDARTIWRISWRWPQKQLAFDKTTSEYSAKVLLPRWENQKSAPEKLQVRWNNYMRILIQHEMQHVLHASQNHYKVAKAVQDAFALDSELTEAQANKIARQSINLIHELDYQYDKTSSHGLEEGVKL